MARNDPRPEAQPPADAVAHDADERGATARDPSSEAQDLELIAQILVGLSRTELLSLRDRFESSDRFVAHLAAAIDEEVTRREEPGRSFTAAMQPIVSRGVIDTVEQDPGSFGRAIAPVMGPALRQSVRQTLQDFMASMERTAQASFTIKGLGWRWEAMRTGRSVAEVALLHSLLYRVEDVFLIERESGVLLHHESFDRSREAREPELVSAMLTAIRSFAVDAFEADRDDGLDSFEVGDLTVWVENSEHLVLAALVRGQAAPEVRDRLEDAVGELELRFGKRFESFDGDVAPFARAAPTLRSCLSERRQGEGEDELTSRSLWPLAALSGLLLLGLVLLVVWGLWLGRRYDRLLVELGDTPGIVVTEARRGFRSLRIEGLHDPLAEPPEAFRERAGFDAEQVPMVFEPYTSNDDRLVVERARIRLDPPADVELSVEDGRLIARGSLPSEWLARARSEWPSISGVSSLSIEGEVIAGEVEGEAIERGRAPLTWGIGFRYDSSELEPASRARLGQLAELLAGEGVTRVTVWGYTGLRPGPRDRELAEERLEVVLDALQLDSSAPESAAHTASAALEVAGVRSGIVDCGEGCVFRAGLLFVVETVSQSEEGRAR